ncbi:MAG: T9SS type A sorting domain-containing protein, partial [Saprospiraceae bacterium]|nr:T9SS type A sorting domain-containing protein [Saprospiraceae bacterium]
HRSDDRGQTWVDISANLPDIAINDMYVLPGHADSVLFVATDAGVYASKDAAQSWHRLGVNMPFVPSFDLDWNPVENTLIAGTFARSIMTYPIDSLLKVVEPPSATKQPIVKIAMNISPNPASSFVNISTDVLPKTAAEISVFDLQGRQIRQAKLPKGKAISHRFDLAALPAGQYFARIKIDGSVGTKRFIKQ